MTIMYPIKMDFVISIITVLFGLIHMSLAQTCSGQKWRDSCYTFSEVNDRRTWQSANQRCQNLGGHLAAVTSTEEQEFLQDQMRSLGINTMWIGGQEKWTKWRWTTDDEHIQKQGCFSVDSSLYTVQNLQSDEITPQSCVEKCASNAFRYAALYLTGQFFQKCACMDQLEESWQTVKGGCAQRCNSKVQPQDSENVLYCGGIIDKQAVYNVSAPAVDLWYRDQPNNYEPYQECMALSNNNKYKWGDEACNKNFYSLCQFNLGERDCRNRGHRFISSPPTCFSEERQEVNWFQARANCKNRENAMDLLKVGTKELFDQVNNTIKDTNRRWWVGATNREWTWASGEPFLFTRFAEGMPSGRNRACVRMERDAFPAYHWSDHSCDQSEHYVCEQLLRTLEWLVVSWVS